MMQRSYDISINDSAIFMERNVPTVRSRKGWNDKTLYKVRFFLEGRDLFFVESVVYHLHPSFREALRLVTRTATNQECDLVNWLWGLFTVTAVVTMSDGNTMVIEHKMHFDKELKEREKDIKYIKR